MTPDDALTETMETLSAEYPELARLRERDTRADAFVDRVKAALVARRKARDISTAEMARRLQVKQPSVSGFEKAGGNVGLKTLARYADALDVDLDRLGEVFETYVSGRLETETGGQADIDRPDDPQKATPADQWTDTEFRELGQIVVQCVVQTARHRNETPADRGLLDVVKQAARDPGAVPARPRGASSGSGG